MMVMAVLAALAALTISGVVMPKPAFAWWRNGVWVPGPPDYGPPHHGPRPNYAAPPIMVAPPPPGYYAPPPVIYAAPPPPTVYVAPPVVIYGAPPPPPVYYPPPAPTDSTLAGTCYAPPLNCPMDVPSAPGATCYCMDSTGDRSYGTAH